MFQFAVCRVTVQSAVATSVVDKIVDVDCQIDDVGVHSFDVRPEGGAARGHLAARLAVRNV